MVASKFLSQNSKSWRAWPCSTSLSSSLCSSSASPCAEVSSSVRSDLAGSSGDAARADISCATLVLSRLLLDCLRLSSRHRTHGNRKNLAYSIQLLFAKYWAVVSRYRRLMPKAQHVKTEPQGPAGATLHTNFTRCYTYMKSDRSENVAPRVARHVLAR